MYKVAVSRVAFSTKPDKDDPVWNRLNGSFENMELTPSDLAEYISDGHPFTVWLTKGWRSSDNFKLGQHLALDFDSDVDLYELLDDPYIRMFCSLVYTTPSHTEEDPHIRAVFLLDTPIYQARNYVRAAKALLWLFEAGDPKAHDAARFFFGSRHCDLFQLGNTMPLDEVKDLIDEYEAELEDLPRPEIKAKAGSVGQLVQSCVDMAEPGQRNNIGYWLACRLAERGLSPEETATHMLRYQKEVANLGGTPYTENEALSSAASAHRLHFVRP